MLLGFQLSIGEVDSISALLQAIVERLTEQISGFVVVDGVSFYEDDGRRAKLLVAVCSLLGLATLERGLILKVLITAPSSALFVWRLFVEFNSVVQTEILEMHRTYPRQNGFVTLDCVILQDDDNAGNWEGGN